MNKNAKVILVIILAVLLIGGIFALSKSGEEQANNQANQMGESGEVDQNASDLPLEMEQLDQTENSNSLVDYSPEKLASSDAEYKVLFFHADWCSVCNAVERNLNAGVIPENLEILKVDYESAQGRTLSEKYDIPIQYTSVLVDGEGNQIGQWVNQFNFGPQEFLDQINEI